MKKDTTPAARPMSKADIIMRKLFRAMPLPNPDYPVGEANDGKESLQEMSQFQRFENRALKRDIG